MPLTFWDAEFRKHALVADYYAARLLDLDSDRAHHASLMQALVRYIEQSLPELKSTITVGTQMLDLTFARPNVGGISVDTSNNSFTVHSRIRDKEAENCFSDVTSAGSHLVELLEQLGR